MGTYDTATALEEHKSITGFSYNLINFLLIATNRSSAILDAIFWQNNEIESGSYLVKIILLMIKRNISPISTQSWVKKLNK